MAKRTNTPEELDENNVDIDNEDEGGRFMKNQADGDMTDVDDDEEVDTGDGTMIGQRANQGANQGGGNQGSGNQGQGKGANQGNSGTGSRSTSGNQSGQQSGGGKTSQSNPKKK